MHANNNTENYEKCVAKRFNANKSFFFKQREKDRAIIVFTKCRIRTTERQRDGVTT